MRQRTLLDGALCDATNSSVPSLAQNFSYMTSLKRAGIGGMYSWSRDNFICDALALETIVLFTGDSTQVMSQTEPARLELIKICTCPA